MNTRLQCHQDVLLYRLPKSNGTIQERTLILVAVTSLVKNYISRLLMLLLHLYQDVQVYLLQCTSKHICSLKTNNDHPLHSGQEC